MAKTVFTDGDPSLGVQGTIVKAVLLNRLNDQVPTGEDIDGSAPLLYASDTGAADAYVMSMTFGPEAVAFPQAYAAGQAFSFSAVNANTGAATLNINALGAKTIKKNVSNDLDAGDIAAGQVVKVIYDGTNFQMQNVPVYLFPSGTSMLFNQALAPAGWTINDAIQDKSVPRMCRSGTYAGSGGSTDIAIADAHTHTVSGSTSGPSATITIPTDTGQVCAHSTHTHTWSATSAARSTSYAPLYIDVIVAVKD